MILKRTPWQERVRRWCFWGGVGVGEEPENRFCFYAIPI